ncbi:MAG: D-2-hydroxyacid dehydrogenase, partial [Acidimicrobiia bacterium]|nr:D-2-hydroxyacid dehydrogenase [Acidimicrobiia bacterium]
VRAQQSHEWDYRMTESLAGTTAIVVGAGGIGRSITRLLTAVGVTVTVLASRTRPDEDLGMVYGWETRADHLPSADWLILATPLTEATRNLIDAGVLAMLPERARFVNIGRGDSVDEPALILAVQEGRLAGAGLDVFASEPLPNDSPFWDLDNVIVTPHHSGDVGTYPAAVVDIFLDNLDRFRNGKPLRNVIDKSKGYGAR